MKTIIAVLVSFVLVTTVLTITGVRAAERFEDRVNQPTVMKLDVHHSSLVVQVFNPQLALGTENTGKKYEGLVHVAYPDEWEIVNIQSHRQPNGEGKYMYTLFYKPKSSISVWIATEVIDLEKLDVPVFDKVSRFSIIPSDDRVMFIPMAEAKRQASGAKMVGGKKI